MLTSIYSTNPYLQVSTPTTPYVSSGPMAGQLRYNTQTNCVEVSNGSSWQQLSGVASISASAEFMQIMDWAKGEMQKSARIKKLAEESVAVADALEAYELAGEKLKVIATLADKETV